jgi:ribosomal-protein-alanine N-acetyltransferase
LLDIKYKLRPFEEEDLAEVVEINRTCLPENYPPYFFLDIYTNYPKTFLVAEVENRLAGYILCRIEFGTSELHKMKVAKKGHVVSIAVLPQYRRRGIGKLLMIASMKAMLGYEALESYLEVRESNQPAINLYNELGFVIARKIPEYYNDGEAAYVMALDFLTEKFKQ